jgi:hypothetical protein
MISPSQDSRLFPRNRADPRSGSLRKRETQRAEQGDDDKNPDHRASALSGLLFFDFWAKTNHNQHLNIEDLP